MIHIETVDADKSICAGCIYGRVLQTHSTHKPKRRAVCTLNKQRFYAVTDDMPKPVRINGEPTRYITLRVPLCAHFKRVNPENALREAFASIGLPIK
jgi:hypothetical protein